MTELWTLVELAARAAVALGDDAEQASARVREIPDSRTIRWYQTTGLVDRPSTLRGRTALYGRRQLLQLVAIKRLQAQGHSLAEIQARLAGISTEALEALADVPATGETDTPTRPRIDVNQTRDTMVVRDRFWKHQRPATQPAAEPATTPPGGQPAAESTPTANAPAADQHAVQGVRLADGVLLVLDHAAGILDPADHQALRDAAAPLLDELVRRGLVATHTRTKEPA